MTPAGVRGLLWINSIGMSGETQRLPCRAAAADPAMTLVRCDHSQAAAMR